MRSSSIKDNSADVAGAGGGHADPDERQPGGGDSHSVRRRQPPRRRASRPRPAQTLSGVATIASLMQQLAERGAPGQGHVHDPQRLRPHARARATTNGRAHNDNHQVSITIGKPFAAASSAGWPRSGSDYGALPIDSRQRRRATRRRHSRGRHAGARSRRRMLAAVGADPSVVSTGAVVPAALA